MLLLDPTHIFAYVVSSRVRLLISAAPANGALKASVQYPMIPMSLMRSLGLMVLKCVVPERMLCMSAAEGDVMVMIKMIYVFFVSLLIQAITTRRSTHM
jgi:hypothetical protein